MVIIDINPLLLPTLLISFFYFTYKVFRDEFERTRPRQSANEQPRTSFLEKQSEMSETTALEKTFTTLSQPAVDLNLIEPELLQVNAESFDQSCCLNCLLQEQNPQSELFWSNQNKARVPISKKRQNGLSGKTKNKVSELNISRIQIGQKRELNFVRENSENEFEFQRKKKYNGEIDHFLHEGNLSDIGLEAQANLYSDKTLEIENPVAYFIPKNENIILGRKEVQNLDNIDFIQTRNIFQNGIVDKRVSDLLLPEFNQLTPIGNEPQINLNSDQPLTNKLTTCQSPQPKSQKEELSASNQLNVFPQEDNLVNKSGFNVPGNFTHKKAQAENNTNVQKNEIQIVMENSTAGDLFKSRSVDIPHITVLENQTNKPPLGASLIFPLQTTLETTKINEPVQQKESTFFVGFPPAKKDNEIIGESSHSLGLTQLSVHKNRTFSFTNKPEETQLKPMSIHDPFPFLSDPSQQMRLHASNSQLPNFQLDSHSVNQSFPLVSRSPHANPTSLFAQPTNFVSSTPQSPLASETQKASPNLVNPFLQQYASKVSEKQVAKSGNMFSQNQEVDLVKKVSYPFSPKGNSLFKKEQSNLNHVAGNQSPLPLSSFSDQSPGSVFLQTSQNFWLANSDVSKNPFIPKK